MPPKAITTREEALNLPLLINAKQVACILGVNERTVLRMAIGGSLPAIKVGVRWRFNRDKILAMAGIA